ncbi:16S rRNA (cytidine(1402)-2'-O)-methyltransferase [candidate division WWE3 bacterium RIFOXYC1_FULL_40_10]|uniref:Ribosomal RNA small subunit methyltransferase I n=1 Tax=candidate division WWE3 bacterium RIFOXYA2_FULL_46_9 TaxID=1802636 RepID=A0A1F4W1J8_UNCKA|nr:MAG: 16S rRNA (cytidine(1402)-2'-O)-methyltransferase [candidate division WWE3 bacterium RIFOXYB1_FULL_40_22]OGC61660.1 MAG: 16S rRNA (cytidine(1402)-2'-O)-methyltransferase [candidate division WWE3 bacterium RIFOXYA1_FULL_40_11]OGC63286.1 MAG: 16S rRNA (cytidine(1402)-2'-O)-methyltransferase [candidate division WWE3 bacterium RIFOXYA2_FULL_46_9]OGC64417.1 MAG: 16S rRNA (cytidine(1402)-2'-O)-methyltransferase [candidate division WWE3 bacterium RIFOXYB2_FULL_41_6]OGC66043.1 MAG: 16S rRNA (cyt
MDFAKTGCLHIVPTPIGNMADITLRSIDILKQADVVLSEDTRETSKLLTYYKIEGKKQVSYRDQNHTRVMPQVLDMLKAGLSIALVSDSGTPLISDPGYKLVNEVKKQGYKVVPLPGPSAIITALSASGLPTDKFIFLGFLPKKSGPRHDILRKFCQFDATICVYESPFRLIKLLEEISQVAGDRTICLASEMTKMYERFETGKISQVLPKLTTNTTRGEHVVLIAKEGFED